MAVKKRKGAVSTSDKIFLDDPKDIQVSKKAIELKSASVLTKALTRNAYWTKVRYR